MTQLDETEKRGNDEKLSSCRDDEKYGDDGDGDDDDWVVVNLVVAWGRNTTIRKEGNKL